MPREAPSLFSIAIQEHLELKRRNAALEYEMPLVPYLGASVRRGQNELNTNGTPEPSLDDTITDVLMIPPQPPATSKK